MKILAAHDNTIECAIISICFHYRPYVFIEMGEQVIKSVKWCLHRLNYDGDETKVVYLNEGDTTIGRNPAADVICTSNICSRNHCTITLNSDDKITIRNIVSLFPFVAI